MTMSLGSVHYGYDHAVLLISVSAQKGSRKSYDICNVWRSAQDHDSVTNNRPSSKYIFHAIAVFRMIVLLGIPFWLLVVTAGKNSSGVVPNMSLPSQWHLLENFKRYWWIW